MVWLKIDDQIAHHPKFIAAGPLASWLWVCGNGYCNKYLTDGFIPATALAALGTVPNARRWASRLVDVGLWESTTDGYRVHDFHDHNPTAAEVKAKRAGDRDRKRTPRGIRQESAGIPVGVQSPRPVPSVPDPKEHVHAPPTQGSGAMAGALPRDHLRHAVCGRVCLHEQQFEQFARKIGGSDGHSKIAAWARTVLAALGEDVPIQGSSFQWWDARWLEFQGKPEAKVRSGVPLPAYVDWQALCAHEPKCTSQAIHHRALSCDRAVTDGNMSRVEADALLAKYRTG